MERPKRADEAGGIYHALKQGNDRADIFHKPEDFDAFERILAVRPRAKRSAQSLTAHSIDKPSTSSVACGFAFGAPRGQTP